MVGKDKRRDRNISQLKSKRILIISTYFPPQPSIASLRAYSFAKYWARMGNEVTVLTTKKIDMGKLSLDLPKAKDSFRVVEIPYVNIIYEGGKILKRLLRKKNDNHEHGVRIINTNGEMINVNRSFLRLRRLISKLTATTGFFTTARIPDVHDIWIWSAVKKGKALLKLKRFDWVFSSYGPPASHLVGGILSRRYGSRWVADYRDLWIEGHIYRGMWPFTALERYLEKKYVGNYADIITTVSEPLADILRKKFAAPVHVIENGYDEDDYEREFTPYFESTKKRIVYTGAIYPGKRDPSPLFVALAAMAQESETLRKQISANLDVLFFGGQNDWLERLIEKYEVQLWVKHMGSVNRHDALRIQKGADLLLFLEWENGSVDGILTGKLFEYLAMRKPILGVGVSSKTSPGTLMEDAGVGMAVGNDVEKITSVLKRLLDTGRPFDIRPKEEVIGRFTRRKQAKRLLRLMDGIETDSQVAQ